MINHATVKSVISGDSLVLIGKSSPNGPPQEITVTLASLNAPRISRGPQQSAEDPFAYESKEFLRKTAIGKSVTFRIVYCVTNINKYFGDVDLFDASTSQSQSLAKLVVAAGWSVVKESRDGKNSSMHDELLQLEVAAKAAKLGIHTTDSKVKIASTRQLKWTPTATDINNLLTKYKDIPTKGIIEYVRDGASFRVYIVKESMFISLSLVGVMAPRVGNSGSGNASSSTTIVAADGTTTSASSNPFTNTASASSSTEPFALQSKHFTELRMLNREVDIVMDSLDSKTGVIFGSILHPKGNIAVELLRNGLARISERNLNSLKKEMLLSFLYAEQEGRNQRRFIWENYEEPRQLTFKGPRVIEGICVEVLSGDTIVVALPPNSDASDDSTTTTAVSGEEVKIILSSIRAPKLAPPSRGGKTNSTPSEPWAVESKEFLRSRLIGKRVTVTVDYERANTTNTQSNNNATAVSTEEDATDNNTNTATGSLRQYGTVHLSNNNNNNNNNNNSNNKSPSIKNIALQLVSEGLALCTRHRRDEPRSADYDALQIAEVEASIKGKGQHGKDTTSPGLTIATGKFNDVSTDSKRAKDLFQLLPKGNDGRTIKAVVEHVFSGARVKISLPSESCVLQLALNQVRCPLGARSVTGQAQRAAEPFSEEARKFTRFHLNQRNVEVVLEDVDKNGVILGKLYILNDPDTSSSANSNGNGTTTATTTGSPWSATSAAATTTTNNGTGSGNKSKRTSFASLLLAAGLARLDKYATDSSGGSNATDSLKNLQEIQQVAQDNKLGIWSIEQPVELEDLNEGELDGVEITDTTTTTTGDEDNDVDTIDGENTSSTTNKKSAVVNNKPVKAVNKWTLGSLVDVQVSEIVDGVTFFVHETEKESALKILTEELSTYATSATAIGDAGVSTLAKGQMMTVLYQESADVKYWCRAKIDEIIPIGKDGKTKTTALVTFIDYGNKTEVEASKLIPLTGTATGSSVKLVQTPPLAHACKLAFLRPPPSAADASSDEWYGPLRNMAGCLLHDLAWGHTMKALIVGVEQDNNHHHGGRQQSKYHRSNNNNNSNNNASSSNITKTYVVLYPASYQLPQENKASSLDLFPSMNGSNSSAGFNAIAARTADEEDNTAVTNDENDDANNSSSNAEESGSTSATATAAYKAPVSSVNEDMLLEGLATLSTKAARAVRKGTRKGSKTSLYVSNITTTFLEKLEAAQELAHKDHLNLFRYGDPGGESDDDFGEDGNSGSYYKNNGSGGGSGAGAKDKEGKNNNATLNKNSSNTTAKK